MTLLNIIKQSISDVLNNPIITMLLVLFLIISNSIAVFITTSQNMFASIILVLCAFALMLCFLSGWFEIFSSLSKGDKKDKSYFGIFLEGIPLNFFAVAIGWVVYIILLLFILFVVSQLANHFFGSLEFILKDIVTIASDPNLINEYLQKLTVDQKYTIFAWQLSLGFSLSIFNFAMLFYFPSIIKNTQKNPFKRAFGAFLDNFRFVFKNFAGAFLLYLTISLISMFFGLLKHAAMVNPVSLFLFLVFYIYFVCFVVMVVFNYYEQKNNCAHGSDCIGQDKNCDKPGENT